MKGPMIIFLVAVFLLLIVAYLAQDAEPNDRFGSKAYHMLLLWLMRLDIAFAHGLQYVQISLAQVFKGYPLDGMDEKIIRKEERLEEYRRVSTGGQEYKKRERYNRKILQ